MRYVALLSLWTIASCSIVTSKVAPGTTGFPYSDDTNIVTTMSVVSGPDSNSTCDAESYYGDISANGRFVVFESQCSNLVENDTNGNYDIFVKNLVTGALERVSVSSSGTEANLRSWTASISGDGRYVVFVSRATNLVSDDTNNRDDIFLHDRKKGTTKRISVSDDGSEVDGHSDEPDISADGSRVVFTSRATDLVSDDTNASEDVFVYDVVDETTQRVTVSSSEVQATSNSTYRVSISGDGRYVAFDASATNLVSDDTNSVSDVFVRDL
jgi:Tol biopolymer transport system component